MDLIEDIEICVQQNFVWNFITDSDIFNDCFPNLSFMTNSWTIGSKIYFMELTSQNTDVAIIDEIFIPTLLSYNYYKNTGNKSIHISFEICAISNDNSRLTVKAKNFSSYEEYNHSKITWKNMLLKIKEYLEINHN